MKDSENPQILARLRNPVEFSRLVMSYRYFFEISSIEKFVAAVEINYVQRTINLSLYQAILEDGNLPSFLLKNELDHKHLDAHLKTFDQLGGVMYSVKFYGLEFVDLKTSFNYSNSDVACDIVIMRFKNYELESKLRTKKEDSAQIDQKKSTDWTYCSNVKVV